MDLVRQAFEAEAGSRTPKYAPERVWRDLQRPDERDNEGAIDAWEVLTSEPYAATVCLAARLVARSDEWRERGSLTHALAWLRMVHRALDLEAVTAVERGWEWADALSPEDQRLIARHERWCRRRGIPLRGDSSEAEDMLTCNSARLSHRQTADTPGKMP